MTNYQIAFWLKWASLVLIGFGLLTFLTLFAPFKPVLNLFFDIALWRPLGTEHGADVAVARLWVAISSGLMVGWGVMLYLIATRLFVELPDLACTMVLCGIGSWFVVDSTGSILAGGLVNAIMNTSFLIIFCLPIALRRKSRSFAGSTSEPVS